MTTSCDSTFDYDDDGRLDYDAIFEDYGSTKSYMSLCYKDLPSYSAWSAGSTFMGSFTDESQDANDVKGSKAYKYYLGEMTSSNNLLNGDLYTKMYNTIRSCNVFIANVDKVPVFTITEYRGRWKAEAYLIRAYANWQLIKHYGPLPYIKEVLPVGYDYSKMERPTFEQCINDIYADLDMALAEPELVWKLTDEMQLGSMTRGVAYAIKSQAALFAASPQWNNGVDKWEQTAAICKETITQLEAKGYGLYTPTNYTVKGCGSAYHDLFFVPFAAGENPTNNETIYGNKNRLDIWKAYGIPTRITDGVTKAGLSPSQELVDAYETSDGEPILDLLKPYLDEDHLIPNYNPKALKANGGKYDPQNPYTNRDKRLEATVYFNGVNHNLQTNTQPVWTYVGGNCEISTESDLKTRTGYYLRKFINWNSSKTASGIDGVWSHYRMAEMYLNYAEAELEAHGPTTEAYAAVNKIRLRAGLPNLPAGLSKDEFRLRLRNERRVEFAFEEHRYFDLRRWMVNQNYEGIVTGMRIEQDPINLSNTDATKFTYNRIVVQKRNVTDVKYRLWPIPLDEELKYNMVGVKMQNAGW